MSLTINRTILLGQTQLASQLNMNSDEAKFETQLLLQHALKVNRAWLVAHALDAIQGNLYEAFEMLLKRRLKGEPIAYILGYREFFGLQLKVSADTLIPRPDTETLVEAALAKIQQHNIKTSPSFPRKRESSLNLNQKMDSRSRGNDDANHEDFTLAQQFRVLDLGTGSGAIALAIAKHRPLAQVTALDASQTALDIAIENAQHLKIPNINFMLSDWFSALCQANVTRKFDVIVSNPPYIEADDAHLKQGDLRFEPLSALASGADGLQDIRIIISQAPQYLNPQGWLLLEHGYNQAEQVAALLKQAGFSQISHAQDLAGINRVTLGKFS